MKNLPFDFNQRLLTNLGVVPLSRSNAQIGLSGKSYCDPAKLTTPSLRVRVVLNQILTAQLSGNFSKNFLQILRCRQEGSAASGGRYHLHVVLRSRTNLVEAYRRTTWIH